MRPSINDWAMNLAEVVATRSTCYRRHVGCVLLDKDNHVLATGYNGVATGLPHCNKPDLPNVYTYTFGNIPQGILEQALYPNACKGAKLSSGEGLDLCEAIHAEQNALLQCRDVREVYQCYTTTSPCITCTKLLLNTGCQEVLFSEQYIQSESRDLWLKAGREAWILIEKQPV